MGPKLRAALGVVTVSAALIGGLKMKEGRALVDYWDNIPAKPVATACYGHTETAKVGTVRTVAECDALLLQDLNNIYVPIVLKYVKVPLTQGQLDALTDFVYNLGEGNFRSSTLLKHVNAGNHEAAALEFEKWYRVGGKDCRIPANKCGGIPKRRAWEKTLYES